MTYTAKQLRNFHKNASDNTKKKQYLDYFCYFLRNITRFISAVIVIKTEQSPVVTSLWVDYPRNNDNNCHDDAQKVFPTLKKFKIILAPLRGILMRF
jgi:hypothetical protein